MSKFYSQSDEEISEEYEFILEDLENLKSELTKDNQIIDEIDYLIKDVKNRKEIVNERLQDQAEDDLRFLNNEYLRSVI